MIIFFWEVCDHSDSAISDIITLLWTNPNPSQSISTKNISVNLTPYRFVFFKFKESTEYDYLYFSPMIKIEEEAGSFSIQPWEGSSVRVYIRGYVIHTNGNITFQTGYSSDGSSFSLSTTNNVLIPLEIWGVK